MKYAELKSNIISKGFAEETDWEEFEENSYTYSAINSAIGTVEKDFPLLAKYEVEIDDTEEGILYFDMTNREGFLALADTPVLFEDDNGIYKKFTDFEIEMENTLVISAENKGTYRIFYRKKCPVVNADNWESRLETEIELPLICHDLLPLLTSYYMWLDDDPSKAAQYYNMYETESMKIQGITKKPKAAIFSGGI